MKSSEIRVLQLEPLRLATLLGSGRTPERSAWRALLDWARQNGCLETTPAPRFFGYDVWRTKDTHDYRVMMTISADHRRDSTIDIMTLPGGMYAVQRVRGIGNIPQAWQQLDDWLTDSDYQLGHHQWLEEHIAFIDLPDEEYVLDLYLPLIPVTQTASG